jgi:glucose/arabinose dehydrogenase
MRPYFALPFLLIACGSASTPAPQPASGKPFVEKVMATFDSPWAMTFLPDGDLLVTEKGGKLKLWSAKTGAIQDVPGTLPVSSAGQGGLMDVVLSPTFAKDSLVYFSFSETRAGGKAVALARGQLVTSGGALCDNGGVDCSTPGTPELTNVEVIFRANQVVSGDGHFSGRIAFSPDGRYLFFTNGERQKFDPAQDPKSTLGKVLRLTPDGKPAPDNPLAAKGFDPAVWSYGHRNLLGIAFDAQGNLWEQEMGPRGGDELNLILPGRNYGWPRASNGSHYDGRDIPDHKSGDGFEPPKVWWNPVISPGGLMIYSGSLFPQWKGDAFIGGLSSESLVRVDLNGTEAAKGDQWPMGGRVREVEQGPDGAIWLLTDEGRLVKLAPKP